MVGLAPETFGTIHPLRALRPLSLPLIVAVALISSATEELVYLGVVANVLRRRGVELAWAAALAVRLAVHIQAKPAGIVSTTILGTIFGAYYLSTNRLWPVVLAQAALGVAGLVMAQ